MSSLPLPLILLFLLLSVSRRCLCSYQFIDDEEQYMDENSSFFGDVHAFFYAWYGNPEHDGKYLHWNHRILPHWNEMQRNLYPKGEYVVPGDIGSSFFPQRQYYSSNDPIILQQQMKELKEHGVDVVIVSWWGQSSSPLSVDGEGVSTDNAIPNILNAAANNGVKVGFHMEPYTNISALSFRSDLQYLRDRYSSHPAYYRRRSRRPSSSSSSSATPTTTAASLSLLPVVYVYDAYLSSAEQWAKVLQDDGDHTIRGTEVDAIVIGLFLHSSDRSFIVNSGFDGFYTYFASNSFTYASNPHNWPSLVSFGRSPSSSLSSSSSSSPSPSSSSSSSLLVSLSVGPGYDDERIRPWNSVNTKPRKRGEYYDDMWRRAISSGSSIVSITSYNEWGEGTQIEPAIPYTVSAETSLTGTAVKLKDYSEKGEGEEEGEEGPLFYMKRTKYWVNEYRRIKREKIRQERSIIRAREIQEEERKRRDEL